MNTKCFVATALGCAMLVGHAAGANIVYQIDPFTTTSNSPQYSVSGTITTNGVIGELTAGDIVDWEIEAAGPIPYTFSPSNPGAAVNVNTLAVHEERSILASSTELSIPYVGNLTFDAHDDSFPECTDCRQSVFWVRLDIFGMGAGGLRGYRVAENLGEGFPDFDVVFSSSISERFTRFATRIPEPGTIVLMLLGTAFVLGCGRRLRH